MSGSPSASHGALPFNKMFIMIPVMLAARKLNNEDPNTVFMLRIAYGVVQGLCLSIILYSYWVVSSLMSGAKKSEFDRVIYVPAPAQVCGLFYGIESCFSQLFHSLTFFCRVIQHDSRLQIPIPPKRSIPKSCSVRTCYPQHDPLPVVPCLVSS
jgi:Phosphate transport (Pho88)